MFFSRPAGLKYVNRGDIVLPDYDKTTLTIDGAWHSLNLVAIIPANAKLVCLDLEVKDELVGVKLSINCAGFSLHGTLYRVKTVVTNESIARGVTVPLTNNAIIQYRVDDIVWLTANISVMGWWI